MDDVLKRLEAAAAKARQALHELGEEPRPKRVDEIRDRLEKRLRALELRLAPEQQRKAKDADHAE
ncbi:MAG: hypothetical protein ABSC04_01535 [Syntrophobacteraceae bacterium]|jgi:hypothetical protein